jgi:hypothetical protein
MLVLLSREQWIFLSMASLTSHLWSILMMSLYFNKKDHFSHLRAVLERCHKFYISLNPKKSNFAVDQGKLLGFVVSKYGMIIDPERTQVIAKLPFLLPKWPCNPFWVILIFSEDLS